VIASDEVSNTGSAETQAAVPGEVTRYYYHPSALLRAGSRTRVAMRVSQEGESTVYYLHADHPSARLGAGLGSTSLTTGADGSVVARRVYAAWGEVRWSAGTLPTDFTFTGQRDTGLGLVFVHARYYHVGLGRWTAADTIVPQPGSPQSLNRYSYCGNSPVVFVDPTGHVPWWFIILLGGPIGGGVVTGKLLYDAAATPPITDESLRPPPPASTDMTSWLIDRMNTNAQAEVTGCIRDSWQSPDAEANTAALTAWVALVRTDAVWDFKVDIARARPFIENTHDIVLGGRQLNYDAVANLHFGFVGRAAGFDGEFLVVGAGLAQVRRALETRNPDDRGTIGCYGDHPYATYFVRFGIYLYGLYENGLVIDETTFAQALDDYIEANGVPPPPPPGAVPPAD
jgi:RHS repeat-associated protein